MTRLIDADALKLSHCKECTLYPDECMGKDCDCGSIIHINEMPTIDAVPVVHGRWIVWDEILAGIYHTVSECSECGFTTDKMQREEMLYCPNCGARMDKE